MLIEFDVLHFGNFLFRLLLTFACGWFVLVGEFEGAIAQTPSGGLAHPEVLF